MTPRTLPFIRTAIVGVFCVLACLLVSNCQQLSSQVFGGSNLVVIDIGHSIGAEGARTPGEVNGRRISECAFWYQYAYYVKREVEKAGYRCIVVNRGYAPTTEPLATYARRARVVHLKHPDNNGERYPSHYHPDRVGSGVISADYAIAKHAACIVFLHHNSSSSRWVDGASNSLIICNRYNGRALGNCLARRMDREILNTAMPNGGRGCKVVTRYVDADRSAAWMNACDDSGIPAAVIEVAYLNNRSHAQFLSNDANARRYAATVGRGVVDFMRTSGKSRRHRRANENAPDEGSFGYAPESRKLNVPGAKLLIH